MDYENTSCSLLFKLNFIKSYLEQSYAIQELQFESS